MTSASTSPPPERAHAGRRRRPGGFGALAPGPARPREPASAPPGSRGESSRERESRVGKFLGLLAKTNMGGLERR